MVIRTVDDDARREGGGGALPPASGIPLASPPIQLAQPRESLVDIFLDTALQLSELPALDAQDRRLTYIQLTERARELASRLRALGVGAGDRVAVRVRSGTSDLYVAILGVLFSGAAYVPVDADDPPARAEKIISVSGSCALIGDGLRLDVLAAPRGLPREPAPDDEAWVIFTSGSTGEPKGVAITHRAAAAFVDAEAGLWSVAPEDRVLAGLSVAFDASCEEMWLAWRNGAALVPAPRELVRAGAELAPWLVEQRVTVVSTVPSLASMWDEQALEHVRLLILGGERCPEELGWRLSRHREVWNTYGPTEATVVSTAARVEPEAPITIGWPLSGWEVAVLDPAGRPVAVGEVGELVVGGVGLGRYLDEALDRERFAGVPALGWGRAYRTGDLVCETVHGLQFIGRRDDQVKVAGRRIELGELDAKLCAAPGVKAALSAVRETAAGNKVLVGYVVGDVEPARVRAALSEELPQGLSLVIVPLESLPRGVSGKLDRKSLPWPPPRTADEAAAALSATEAWLAERWGDQLGPLPIEPDSDFFALGGTSLAAAKLVSALRERFPAVAVADVYRNRTLARLAARLEQLEAVESVAAASSRPASRRWSAAQLAGVLALRVLIAPQWLIGVLALNRLEHGQLGPQLSWGWLIGAWLLFVSVPGRAVLLAAARRLLLRGVRPGRYPRRSWLMLRIWLLERLADSWRLRGLEGTPWAARYARLSGHSVGRGARLLTLPPVASLVSIGERATVESQVDMEGWWIEGEELAIDAITIGSGARIGTHSVLMPGTRVGPGAELELGCVVSGPVPAGSRWAGSPGREVGRAGEQWPTSKPPPVRRAALWRAMFALGMLANNLLPLAAVVPGLLFVLMLAPSHLTGQGLADDAIVLAPALVLSYLVGYGLLIALLVRAVSPLLRPGWHPEEGAVGFGLWLTGALMTAANGVMFALYLTVYTRLWLRLLGVRVGRGAEASVSEGLNRLTTLGDTSFVADAVVFANARSRQGWLHVAPIEIGSKTFLGNGAIVEGGTVAGDGCLVGVITHAPRRMGDGTSWFGSPALELPRRPEPVDVTRTTAPPRRLVAARGAVELVRILLPASLSVLLGSLMFDALERIGSRDGAGVMALSTPVALLAAGLVAAAMTIVLKWLLMGRYERGEHPLWSFFVWRDEIMNTCQEQLAGTWLIRSAEGTPLMSLYLRLMGSRVGRDVWCETLTITEFDMVELGDGAVVNRHGVVETHLFHDRLLRIGPVSIGPGATLGPISASLPESVIGAGTSVGARSVVMGGERLPAGTRWHGAPVVAR